MIKKTLKIIEKKIRKNKNVFSLKEMIVTDSTRLYHKCILTPNKKLNRKKFWADMPLYHNILDLKENNEITNVHRDIL